MAFSVIMSAPSGVGTANGASGTIYTVNSQNLITVTNAGDVAGLLNGGFQLVGPSGARNFRANFRNLLDGGDFTTNPYQRNIAGLATSNQNTTAIANTLTYFPDRWFAVGGASSAIQLSQSANTSVPGFANSCRFQRKSANSNTAAISFGQVIETGDSIRCQGQTVTLSFWAAGTAVEHLQVFSGTGTNDTAANMVAAAWAGSTFVINTTQALVAGAAMQRFQFQGTVPAGCTQLGVLFTYTPVGTAGATDYVEFMGIQMEIGASATDFEARDVQVELEICQRYAWVIPEPASGVVVGMGDCPTTTTARIYMATPVQLLKAPTVSVTTGSFNFRPANAAASGTAAAGTTHTPNAITVNGSSLTATTAGFATPLLGGGGSGFIIASADF